MTTILANRQTRRRGIAFTILIAITLLLMAFSGNPYIQEVQRGLSFALRPFQGAIAGVAGGVSGLATAITEIDQLRSDNGALRDENERLANENARLRALKQENDELTALLQLQGGFDHQTVAVRVIGREMLETRRVVTIDKGTDDHIELGDAVVVQGGALAGKVTDVGPTFAKVTLISDSTSTVVGKLLNSGETGDIVGQAGGVLIMRNIDSAVEIGVDEEVFTAGLELGGGIRSPYPAGLIVGSVVDVERDANDVVQTAFLAPAANLNAFELALVITDYDGGLPPVDEQPVPCGEEGTVPEGEVECFTPGPSIEASPRVTPKP
ncbi:MAG TPA: rod shape-determining protein MreC [Candidatus Limnocylindrales bacterium]|nr:rod shape-determining protein MreC [Candidatus Limnocylindrales bacterium]